MRDHLQDAAEPARRVAHQVSNPAEFLIRVAQAEGRTPSVAARIVREVLAEHPSGRDDPIVWRTIHWEVTSRARRR